MYEADEAFVTGTPFCILPVTSFEFKPIGEGVFGKTTKLLLEKWSQNVDVNIQQQIIDYNLEHSLNIEGSTPYQHKSNN